MREEPPGSVTDNRERVPDREYYSDQVVFPGYGAQPERCMPLKPVAFCQDHGHPELGRSSCDTWRCPEHWPRRLTESVKALTARLAAMRHVADGLGKRLLHVVLSPDVDKYSWTSDRLFETRRDAYDVAESVGIRGGEMFVHPYRSSREGDMVFRAKVDSGEWDESRGKYSLFRELADDWDEMSEFIEPSPHYHTLAFCEDLDVDAIPDDWVVNNIGSLDSFHYRDIESYRPMAKVAHYLLTHSAYLGGRNIRTSFGEFHSFTPKEELTAAEWERIQRNAGVAVDTKPGEGISAAMGNDSIEGRECPRDGCESTLVPIDRLNQYLSNEAWKRSLEPEQLRQLQGIRVWSRFPDRPPPGDSANTESVLAWLRELGQMHNRFNDPTGLQRFA